MLTLDFDTFSSVNNDVFYELHYLLDKVVLNLFTLGIQTLFKQKFTLFPSGMIHYCVFVYSITSIYYMHYIIFFMRLEYMCLN